MSELDALIVGGGPAGLGAAARLKELGAERVLVLDREAAVGGLPHQCGHRGFGFVRFGRPLTGVDFARRLESRARRAGALLQPHTTVLGVDVSGGVLAVGSDSGVVRHHARVVILATGCREMPWAERGIVGARPAGVFNTAVVQRFVHQSGVLPGRDVVIAGSEDLGLMAVRLLAQSGARVCAVVEETDYLLGYKANYLYSVAPFRVPVLLGHRIVGITGRDRVTGVELEATVGGARRLIPCDTLVLSGRFVPESSLAREAGIAIDPLTRGPAVDQHYRSSSPAVFACGNVLHGAESADVALAEGERAGEAAWAFLSGRLSASESVPVVAGANASAVLPQRFSLESARAWVMVRPSAPLLGPLIEVSQGHRVLARALRPWAVPHRTLKMQLRLPSEREQISVAVWAACRPRPAGRSPASA